MNYSSVHIDDEIKTVLNEIENMYDIKISYTWDYNKKE